MTNFVHKIFGIVVITSVSGEC